MRNAPRVCTSVLFIILRITCTRHFLDKAEWLHDIQHGDCSLKGFLSIVGDSINEREIRKFEEGLNTEVNV